MFPISVISQELDTAKAGKPEFLYDLGIKIEPTRESVPPEGGIGVANSGLSTIQAQLDSLYMAINKNKTLTAFKIEKLSKENDSLANEISKLKQKIFLSPYSSISSDIKIYSKQEGLNFYKKGHDAFVHNKYEVAIDYFTRAVSSKIPSASIGDAYYWIGYCHIQMNDKYLALEYLKKVAEYPIAEKFGDALFLSAVTYQNLDNIENANIFYKRLIDRFPGTKLARLASLKIKSLKLVED